jgi:ankyrin repeat protein
MNKRTACACLAVAAFLPYAAKAWSADALVARAASKQDGAALRALIGRGADVNAPLPDGATALHWAVHWNDEMAVELLLRAGAAVNVSNEYGIAPISLACTNRNDGLVSRLLAAGADPNSASNTGETVLMTCAYTGNAAAVRALVQRGADVNRRESLESQTALMWAAAQGHEDVVKVLLDAGADLRTRAREQEHFVCFTTQCGNGEASQRNAGRVFRGGYSATLFAARQGDVGSVKVLLDHGASIEERGADGYSPLLLATHSGHTGLAKFLLQRGADPNASGVGYSALHTAVLRGDVEMTKVLIAAGAAVNSRITKPAPMERFTDKWMVLPVSVVGYTPLQMAARYVETPIIRALLAAGADPNVTSADGTTLLMDAAGVNMNRNGSTDRRGRTVDVAVVTALNKNEDHILEAVQVLTKAGVSVTATNRAGDTALHGAAGMGMRKVFQYLVDKGADPNVKNKRGRTPRSILQGGGGSEPEAP